MVLTMIQRFGMKVTLINLLEREQNQVVINIQDLWSIMNLLKIKFVHNLIQKMVEVLMI